jgi:hypothetical protein
MTRRLRLTVTWEFSGDASVERVLALVERWASRQFGGRLRPVRVRAEEISETHPRRRGGRR